MIEGTIDEPALRVEKVADDRLVLVVHRDHPWSTRSPTKWKDFCSTPWVLREPGSGTRAMFEAALKENGIPLSDLDISLELPSNEAVLAATISGAGTTAISELAAVSALRSRMATVVPFELPMRSFYLVRHRERHLAPAAAAFASALTEEPDHSREGVRLQSAS